MQVLMVQELHHIYSCYDSLSCYDGVVLCAGFGIDQQQAVCTQSETREGGEERQIHFADLVLTGDIFRCRLTCNRCQTFRREDDIHGKTCYRYHDQHEPQKRPTEDFQCAFHKERILLFGKVKFVFLVVTLVVLQISIG